MSDDHVHVVDDDEAVRESLTFLLSAAGFPTRAYESGEAFLEVMSDIEVGCLITDVRMPGMSGIDLLRKVKQSGKPIEVIVVTGHGDVPLAVRAMKLGAAEFLEKPYDEDSLLAAVKSANTKRDRAAGIDAEKAAFLTRLTSLSNREQQVLKRLVAGLQNKETARELGISPRTVEVYRANVMGKMQASSLSELVRMALTAGIERDEPDL